MAVSLSKIREIRNMSFIKRGMRIEVDGHIGKICSGNISDNLNVRFEGERFTRNCHPFYKTRYFDKSGNVIQDYADKPF